ncbi:MAG: type III-B CRISPR module-associated protein Cmr5 [bacterium]|nr:type III-B CRISPR module-associated protein Cmr5 [bacterium]
MLKTIEQERAKFAFTKIQDVKNKNNKEYKSLSRGFASMILQNGLGQSLAFLKAKGKDHHLMLYEHINEWCKVKFKISDILESILNSDSSRYRLYTKEVLSLLIWIRKFAEAELEDLETKA